MSKEGSQRLTPIAIITRIRIKDFDQQGSFMSITQGISQKIRSRMRVGKSIEKSFGKISSLKVERRSMNKGSKTEMSHRKAITESGQVGQIMTTAVLLVRGTKSTKSNTKKR